MLMFLPTLFHGIVGDAEWLFPGVPVELFGVGFKLSIIGNALEVGADGAFLVNSGLAFTLANLTAIFFSECINFPLQRNVTFKSHGPLSPQIGLHLLATIAVFLVMNLFTCVWNPVTVALIHSEALRNTVSSIVTTVVTGGVAMVIIFAWITKFFLPTSERNKEETLMELKKKAVIFDLDGVICFTDKLHYQAWKALADRLGIYFDEKINDRLRPHRLG